MKYITLGALLLAGLTFSACASTPVFPPDVVEGVDPDFDFARWRMLPNQAEAKKIQLGGRIVNAETKGDKVAIVVAQLPIVENPAYGPIDTGKNTGVFAIAFEGSIKTTFLQPGNRLIVIGMTHAPMVVNVDDLPRSLPTVLATCVHFWKTGGRDIADFPSYGGGYEPLQEETVCRTNH